MIVGKIGETAGTAVFDVHGEATEPTQDQMYAEYMLHQLKYEEKLAAEEKAAVEAELAAVKRAATELRIRTALHDQLGLSDDQAVVSFSAYNTEHRDREGKKLEGGEMVVRAEVAGSGIEGKVPKFWEVTDHNRIGLDEDIITELGAYAMAVPKVIRTVLRAS